MKREQPKEEKLQLLKNGHRLGGRPEKKKYKVVLPLTNQPQKHKHLNNKEKAQQK